ncbi:VWA domain-containing protein [Candidatus Poribacteria bacterium]|nr:VWA domain-containing protein [Candidatus Poribacteria bacterium]
MGYIYKAIALSILLSVVTNAQSDQMTKPVEAQQVLFIIDDSSSMTETAFMPDDPQASRWEVLRKVFPEWLNSLDSDTFAGAISVGGVCGENPKINIPLCTDRERIKSELRNARPHGNTNLNSVLKSVPQLFDMSIQGGKRIILLSDGLNTCPPLESTCEIAAQLHSDYGIVIDVVAWITESKMEDEFRCVARVTGGTFIAPKTVKDWQSIPLSDINPWSYVVFVLGFATLVLSSRILYRQCFHVFNWNTGKSTMAGGFLMLFGALALYMFLFVESGGIALILGVFALFGVIFLLSQRQSTNSDSDKDSFAQWPKIAILLILTLIMANICNAQENYMKNPDTKFASLPYYHHILAIDLSGSVTKYLEEMKYLLARYAEIYTHPGEEVSLVGFAYNTKGSVKKLYTFTIPPSGSTIALSRILDDLQIQNPKQTKTYYKPLADFLNNYLKGVKLHPVIVVISDGRSDGLPYLHNDELPFKEISFESLGIRGVYAAPGINNWKVAVAGGDGLDLTTLFQKPIPTEKINRNSYQPLTPILDPELIEPAFYTEVDRNLSLSPNWNPFSHRYSGKLFLRVHNEQVARFRTFRVELRHGNKAIDIGGQKNILVDKKPKEFIFPISWDKQDDGIPQEAIVQVILEQGNGIYRTIYPDISANISIIKLGYLSEFWFELLVIFISFVLLIILLFLIIRKEINRKQNQKQIVRIMGGSGAALSRYQSIMIGGKGCSLEISGVPDGLVFGTAEWKGVKGEIAIQPFSGIQIRVNGIASREVVNYNLGYPIQFITEDGNAYDFTLYSGTYKDITPGVFPDPTGLDNLGTEIHSQSFGDIISSDSSITGLQFSPNGGNNQDNSKYDPYI